MSNLNRCPDCGDFLLFWGFDSKQNPIYRCTGMKTCALNKELHPTKDIRTVFAECGQYFRNGQNITGEFVQIAIVEGDEGNLKIKSRVVQCR